MEEIIFISDEEMDDDDILDIADGGRKESDMVVVVSDEDDDYGDDIAPRDDGVESDIQHGVDEENYRDEYGEGRLNTPIRMMNELRTNDKVEYTSVGEQGHHENRQTHSHNNHRVKNITSRIERHNSEDMDISSDTTAIEKHIIPRRQKVINGHFKHKEESKGKQREREGEERFYFKGATNLEDQRERERKQQGNDREKIEKRLEQQQQQQQEQQEQHPQHLQQRKSLPFLQSSLFKSSSSSSSSSPAPVTSSSTILNVNHQNNQGINTTSQVGNVAPDDDDLMILPNQVAFKRVGMAPEKPDFLRPKVPAVIIKKPLALASRTHRNEVPRSLICHDGPGRFSTEIQDYVNGILKDPKASRELKEQVCDPSFFELWINDERQKEEPDSPIIEVLPSLRRKGGKKIVYHGNARKIKGPDFEFIYTPRMIYNPSIALPTPNLGCSCIGPCSPFNENCECLQRQKLVSNQGILSFAYDSNGHWRDEFLNDAIWECNSTCGCSPDCRNRVVGNGRTAKLDLIRTPNKGWGVFAREDIAEGQYIVLYSGEVMLSDDAEKRGHLYKERTYLFDLDNMSIFDHVKLVKRLEREMSRPPEERNFQPACEAELRAMHALCDSAKEAIEDMEQNGGIDETATSLDAKYSIDAFHYGNLGRYVNHACQPNAFLVPVYIDETNALRPLLAIFAYRPIRQYEEVTISYSGWASEEAAAPEDDMIKSQPTKSASRVKGDGPIGDECRCGGPQCRGYMFVQR